MLALRLVWYQCQIALFSITKTGKRKEVCSSSWVIAPKQKGSQFTHQKFEAAIYSHGNALMNVTTNVAMRTEEEQIHIGSTFVKQVNITFIYRGYHHIYIYTTITTTQCKLQNVLMCMRAH